MSDGNQKRYEICDLIDGNWVLREIRTAFNRIHASAIAHPAGKKRGTVRIRKAS